MKVEDDRTWSGDGISGTYIAGADPDDDTRFIYFDSSAAPVSGEVYSTTTDKAAAESFWETHH